MSCNCRSDIEEKLLVRYKEKMPDASEHKISLDGYGFFLVDNTFTMQGKMGIVGEAVHILKNGNRKPKKIKQDMCFTYCPFCGKNYSDDDKPLIVKDRS